MQGDRDGTSRLSKDGDGVRVATKLGNIPLDLTVLGDDDAYPGTIWVADNLANTITILEPADF